jgi:heme A synthase
VISLILFLVIIGVVLWAITQLPMDDTIRRVIHVVVIVVVVVYVAQFLLGAAPGPLAWPGR